MARPTKPRSIRKFPAATTFQPSKSGSPDTVMEIGFDEFEAMRLSDVEHMSQEEVAQMMNVSRQSIQLMLQTAREKLTRALLDGQTISIGGGHVQIYHCPLVCQKCQYAFTKEATELPRVCPECGSDQIGCSSDDFCALHCQENK